jgi:8-oxo-dGTP pyrophosphatase MutT (NUDIX family)
MIVRVRGVLITAASQLLTIRRERPGTPVYWVLPGGGVEPTDNSYEDALRREVREELAAEIRIHSMLHSIPADGENQLIYLADVGDRST